MTEADAELIEKVRKWLAAHDASDYYASAILSQCPEDVSRAFVRCADEVSAQSAEIARLREALKPFAAAAGSFSWIDKKGIDREGVYLWCESSNGGITKKISAGSSIGRPTIAPITAARGARPFTCRVRHRA